MIDAEGWLPVDGRIPPADVPRAVTDADHLVHARRRRSRDSRRVLRGLVHAVPLASLLRRAGIDSGMRVLLWRCGPAAELPALMTLGASHVSAIDEAGQISRTAARWCLDKHTSVRAGDVDVAHAGAPFDAAVVVAPPSVEDLGIIRRLLHPGGVVAAMALPPVPDTVYAWDRSLQARVNAALTGQRPPGTASAVITRLRAAGRWAELDISTAAFEHLGARPPPLLAEFLVQDYALRAGPVLHRRLAASDRDLLRDLHDPSSPAHLLDRDDLHVLQLDCIVSARLPAARP